MLDTRAIFVGFVDEGAVRLVFLLNTLVFPCHYGFTNAPYLYLMCLTSSLHIIITDDVIKQSASFLWQMKPCTVCFVSVFQ
jgi:hypothetical protein